MSLKKHQQWDRVVELEMGILGPQCPAMSRQHSFTYSVLCDHQRRALTGRRGDQTGQLGILWEFLKCWLLVRGVFAAGITQIVVKQ